MEKGRQKSYTARLQSEGGETNQVGQTRPMKDVDQVKFEFKKGGEDYSLRLYQNTRVGHHLGYEGGMGQH